MKSAAFSQKPLVLALALALSASPVWAADITFTPEGCQSANPCKLGTAINAAQPSSGDTVNFSEGTLYVTAGDPIGG
jgi:hypothetical protein